MGGDDAATRTKFVRTVVRVIAALSLLNVAGNLWTAFTIPRWQHAAMCVVSAALLIGVALARSSLRRGEPERALERLYGAIFLTILGSVPLVHGSHTMVALGLAAFVLSTAPSVLPLARVDRWGQAAAVLGIATSVFDAVTLPTQLPAVEDTGFEELVAVGVAFFVLVLLRNFRRYPVRTKLTVAFLTVAVVPLSLAAALRPAPGEAAGPETHLLILAVAAGACVIAFVLGRLLADPLTAVAEAMGRFTEGDVTARAHVRSVDEIGVVAGRFNALAEELGRVLASLRSEVAARTLRETELEALNEALASARDAATTANRAKSTFLAHMSHELRTPLNAIIGYGELIAEESGEPSVRADAERVLLAARHLLGIISDILDLSKIEAGKTVLALADFDAVALAREVCETSRPLMERRANRLHFAPGPAALRIRGDPRKLQQVLLNLLSNAAKFTDRGQVWCEVRGEPEEAPRWAVFSVRDEGIGIPPDQIGALFQPFMQLDATPSRRYEGTGLGLTISRHFVEMMGGSIEVDSRPGVGSTFTVRIPVAGGPPP